MSVGMVGALGDDVATNCAAARAGITRSATLEHYRSRSAVDGLEEPINGHQAGLFTRGFEGEARLIRLAQGALVDLMRQLGAGDWARRRHEFYLSLPEAGRARTGLELIADEEVRRGRLEEEAERLEVEKNSHAPSPEASHAARGARILHAAAKLAAWPVVVSAPRVCFAGHTGGLDAIRTALTDLASGGIEMAVVLGVDSFLDEETLDWLNQCGRLKSDGSPAGLQPGEAGVAIAMMAGHALAPAAPAARVRAASGATERRTLISGACAAGEALAQVVADCWDDRTETTPWIISDHNGEVYRATDWGHAVVRLRAQFKAFDSPVLWHPAASFGDTGAASALVAICVAVRAWDRQYAPAPTAIVTAAADAGNRAGLALERTGVH